MRLIHFSDTHLGYSDLNKVDPATGVNRREQDACCPVGMCAFRAFDNNRQ
jgi:hypothetical protein